MNERRKKSEVRGRKSVQEDSFGEVGMPDANVGGAKFEGTQSAEENQSAIGNPSLQVRRTPMRAGTTQSALKEPPTENSKLFQRNSLEQTEQMEVHHHPDLHHGKKPWKEYLLEFLMIFLAVTMGFFAENIREGISEASKGKEYIRSFVQDLQSDTARYDRLIISFTAKDSTLAHLNACFDTLEKTGHTPKYMYNIIWQSSFFFDFIYSDRTIQQLKNAGGLRMIHEKAVADSIIDYDARVRSDMIHQETLEQLVHLTVHAHENMLGFKNYNLMLLKKWQKETVGPELNMHDMKQINTYFNVIFTFRSTCLIQLRRVQRLRSKATGLIRFLQDKED